MSIRPVQRHQSLKHHPSVVPSRQSLGGLTPKGQSPSKKKDKESELRDIDLHKYCPYKTFNVLFLNEADKASNKIVEKIIEMSKEFEDISYLTFITYDDIVSLAPNYEAAVLPVAVKTILVDFLKSLKLNFEEEEPIAARDMARLMKLKLIEVMYGQYAKIITKKQSRIKLLEDLKTLTAECSPKDKASKKMASKPGTAASIKKFLIMDSQSYVDYTTIPIEIQDDIVFDDDIHHHIAFYIFQGFYDPDLLKELIVNNGVEIQGILKFSTQSSEKGTYDAESCTFSDFWHQIYQIFDGPKRCPFLENTFLMTYTATCNDIKQVFEELLHVVRNVTEVKLQHVNYVRHMDLFRWKEIFSYFHLEYFTVYNNFFQKIPMELVNIPVLLDVLLKQVTLSVDETVLQSESQHSYLEGNDFEQSRCIDPCSIDAFFKRKANRSKTSLWNPIKSFLTYENDELFITFNSYKKHGPLVHEMTKNVLKNAQPLRKLNDLDESCMEIIHKHDVDPSTKTVIQDADMILHFLYLFLFNTFRYKTVLPTSVKSDLTKNLVTYNKLDFIRDCQTILLPSNDEPVDIESNLYNVSPIEYYWKEELGVTMLLQQIAKAQDEYLYCQQRVSPETDNVLIQFSNCLDEFGLNTKIYDQSLPTVICLRDFCKYIVEEKSDWLENNKLPRYVRKCVVREECQGARNIVEQNLFPEYNYLFEAETHQETKPDEVKTTDNEITFDQLMEEIKHYPSNVNLVKECGKIGKLDLVYDFGTKYFQIKGAKTTFQSHDDVKLTIDNTVMLDEYPKCSVCLDCRGNSLVLHTGKFYAKEDYNFNVTLADGTIVSFIFHKHKKLTKSKDSVLFQTENAQKEAWEREQYDYKKCATTVLSVDQSYFQDKVETNLLNEEYLSSTDIAFKPSSSMLQRLLKAARSEVPIYKINNNLSQVKKLKPEFEIPLTNIVKRVLHNTVPKENLVEFTKRYLPIKGIKQQLEPEMTFDARVALPNGLYISFYPSKLKKGLVEVKQEFLCPNSSTELEEFRLFTRSGYVLIKKIDGSITVLKSSGDVVEHEKVDTDSENVAKWRTKTCHCKDIEDYRKRVCKLFKFANEEATNTSTSRRVLFRTKKGYVVKPQTMEILKNNKLPYLKSSVLKFDGTRVCLEADKMRVKKVLHLTYVKNFLKNEVYYERADGFHSTIDRDSRQLVEFTDGTKITSSISVAPDLVDGYVYISLGFEFQHPNYASVAYGSDDTLKIQLNNAVITKQPDDVVLKIDEDITTSVSKERVLFEKACLDCEAKYTCDIDISAMVSGDVLCGKFLHASDSYNKHFYCDDAGKCERNQDYIKGPFNSFGCNHYSKMSYKKLFVVNRDLTGCTFWTDNMVLAKKQAMSQDEDEIREFMDSTNSKVLVCKFERKIYDLYANRFLNKSLINNSKQLVYSTFCQVKRMVDNKIVEHFCKDLMHYVEKSKVVNTTFTKSLETVVKENETHEQESEWFIKSKEKVVEEEKCKCEKQRITIREKIERWRRERDKYKALIRNRQLPCYFDSEFCKVIPKQ